MNNLKKTKINSNFKSKTGITFFVLVITIMFILIITSTLTISFFNIIDSTNKKEFANEINSLQKLVEQYKFINNKYPVAENEFSFSLVTLRTLEKEQFLDEPGYVDNEVILKEIDLYEAGVEEITRGIRRNDNELDIYVISENTGKVYYLKGEEYDDIKYYTLTNDLKKSLGI